MVASQKKTGEIAIPAHSAGMAISAHNVFPLTDHQAMTTILIASNNAHKAGEFREIAVLAGMDRIAFLTPADLGLDLDPAETGLTYTANALIKSRAFAKALTAAGSSGEVDWVLSDDSGLEVDALDGRPGLLSARYHKNAPDNDGCAALLKELLGVAHANRGARFRAVLVLSTLDRKEQIFEGVCEGRIGLEKRGINGFGFDPVFMVDKRAMAELPSREKHVLSHRGVAMRRLLAALAR
jgi:XTP/dITP diphosphohydrolase